MLSRLDNSPIVEERAQRSPSGAVARAVDFVVPIADANDVVYGLLLIGAVLAGESGKHDTFAETVGATIVASVLAWLAHAYSTLLSRRLIRGAGITRDGVREALARDVILLRGGAVPLVALVVSWALGLSEQTGVTVAIVAVVATIVALEVLAAVASHASPSELLIDGCFGLALGLAIFLLKIVLH